MIYLIGLSIAFFLFLLILLKTDKKGSDYILSAWIFILFLHLSLFYMQHKAISYQYPYLLGIILPLPLLHGPFLYFYTLGITQVSSINAKKAIMHLSPFLLMTALAIPFFNLSAQEKIEIFKNGGKGFEWYMIPLLITIIVSGMSYSAASITVIYKHRREVLNNYSNAEKLMLRWLEYLAIGLGMIWVLAVFFDDAVIFGSVTLFVLFIGFFGINQVPIFYAQPSEEPVHTLTFDDTDHLKLVEKYAKTGLKEEEAASLMKRLETLMKVEKPFKNCELTLADLANTLDIPTHQLSQVINSVSGKTFYNYINAYRIEEFLELISLPENKKYTLLALAFDCGFNSKTTFNKYFKIHTGKTPSEYLNANPDTALISQLG